MRMSLRIGRGIVGGGSVIERRDGGVCVLLARRGGERFAGLDNGHRRRRREDYRTRDWRIARRSGGK